MPDVSVGSQIFDIVFHPAHCTAYAALLSGQVKAITYDHQGRNKESFSVSVSHRSCRGLSINGDGTNIYVVGKGKALHTIDTTTGRHAQSRAKAHEQAAPINRVRHLTSWLLSTGDDDGVIKLWDPRQKESIRKYTHHFDYITDFLWLDDKKQLVATSGDGTLSVIDVRSKNTKPIAQSEDQEDELLSIVAIKGSTKFVVGTQIGVLSIFNRSSGWGDCVDRIPGHPHSVDTLCALPESFTDIDATSTILTGSSDGFVRAVQIFPTKLLGVVADHGEWPVEKVAIGDGQNFLDLEGEDEQIAPVAKKSDHDEILPDARWWIGSAGHDETLKLTSLRGFFNGDDGEGDGEDDKGKEKGEGAFGGNDAESAEDDEEEEADSGADNKAHHSGSADDDDDSDSDSPAPPTKRKRKKEENPLMVTKRKKGRNEVEVEGRFFDDL
ncbi:WD40 repeat-like protein [Guyanagaster necrorhizus]|uniref:WD repeat-containing protein JIP5 n=1 Tax=Guyanagaster necrorhizus TaxID=856835 RepID=A0A9P7VRM2_9AGAR|nr:WD40 repeat-like protein [Guyanagaster necrorhizus MCA 3950]KAG7445200.1 WD40 repeat-like protein [Guyanagaster necrorhizus MCA 3950]